MAETRNVAALTSMSSAGETMTSSAAPRPGPTMPAAYQLATSAPIARSVCSAARPGSADFAAGW